MSKLIRVNINLDNSHSLTDFPVDIYSGTTTGNATNLVYGGVTTSPVTFTVDDSIMDFGLKLVSTGCLDQVLLIESPSLDCEICADFVEYYDPVPSPTPQTTQTVLESCIGSLTFVVEYNNSSQNGSPCSGGHGCNRAVFDILANSVVLGQVNLNNGGGIHDDVNRPPTYPNYPGASSGDRYNALSITSQQAQSIAANSPNGLIDFSFDCACIWSGANQNCVGSSCHTDVSWVRIIKDMGLSTEEELYNGCPNGNFIEDFDPCPPQETPTPTPSPSTTASPTPSPSPNTTASPTPSPSPNTTASPTPSPSPSPSVTASPTPTPSVTPPPTEVTFNCGMVGLDVEDGVAGEPVVFTTNSGTISPSTYTTNPYINYEYTIAVPSGYSNSGTSIICSDNDVTVTNPANPPTNQNIIIKGFVSSSSGSSFPVYDGMGDIGEYNINGSGGNGSGKAHQIYNGSDETIYVRLMAKTYGGNQSFDAMAKILFSSPAQDVGDLIYIGNVGGSQNANYQTTISNNNPAYGGAQWVIEIPPTGYNSVTVGIHPAYYVPDGDNVYYTFAWSLNEVFVRADQNEITTYVA